MWVVASAVGLFLLLIMASLVAGFVWLLTIPSWTAILVALAVYVLTAPTVAILEIAQSRRLPWC